MLPQTASRRPQSGSGVPAGQLQQPRQHGCKARAAGQQSGLAPGRQPVGDLRHIPVRLSFIDQHACFALCGTAAGDIGAQCIRLFMQNILHTGMRHRLKGVLSKHTLGNGHAADVVYAAAGDAVQIREGGHEMEPVASIRCQRGGKLCPDIPAQRGICLFIDASDLFFLCPAHQAVDRIICLRRRKVACLGIHHEHLCLRVCLQCLQACPHNDLRGRSIGGKLYACIQRACKIIRNYK